MPKQRTKGTERFRRTAVASRSIKATVEIAGEANFLFRALATLKKPNLQKIKSELRTLKAKANREYVRVIKASTKRRLVASAKGEADLALAIEKIAKIRASIDALIFAVNKEIMASERVAKRKEDEEKRLKAFEVKAEEEPQDEAPQEPDFSDLEEKDDAGEPEGETLSDDPELKEEVKTLIENATEEIIEEGREEKEEVDNFLEEPQDENFSEVPPVTSASKNQPIQIFDFINK